MIQGDNLSFMWTILFCIFKLCESRPSHPHLPQLDCVNVCSVSAFVISLFLKLEIFMC